MKISNEGYFQFCFFKVQGNCKLKKMFEKFLDAEPPFVRFLLQRLYEQRVNAPEGAVLAFEQTAG